MSAIVVGDMIHDVYRFCQATRLCPEAPVPVLVEGDEYKNSAGGAGLVAEQLNALNIATYPIYGSRSIKERIFAGRYLVCRIDDDNYAPFPVSKINQEIEFSSKLDIIPQPSLVLVSDYGKGTFTKELAEFVIQEAHKKNIPVFVDAKHHWDWFQGAFAAFPNANENPKHENFDHVIQKLGPLGCKVDDDLVSTEKIEEADTTGAGDIFMASFAAKFLDILGSKYYNTEIFWHDIPTKEILIECAEYANKLAGISVKYLGTHIVTKEEI